MDISPYLERLRRDLAVAAESGGEDTRAFAEWLTTAFESSAQLVLLEALSDAADEITREMAPGSVELRLRGRQPTFVVSPAPDDEAFDEAVQDEAGYGQPGATGMVGGGSPAEADDDSTSRFNLRLPESLKLRIEEAARQEGLSLNAWLVRAAAAAVEPEGPPRRIRRRPPTGGQRYTGWVR
ncbi:toxin-antitoxin system HicB family antitoxin [Haloechinothrix sp. LS1_15]|uniref:toxin-antitoxin system HicB family antitoxin n=1 Tax=Haloechinothrix sp. LS1_15 TaxID=2652248 RepID=UPI0029475B92|nr:toxin-antitoxin system HicB family antitoxin [Haloechinothrix sp. LS1_15]MDV6011014.1 toxin-antitoxin system HicB family antitoxin [Haloechinothrix sp. LS1_15]